MPTRRPTPRPMPTGGRGNPILGRMAKIERRLDGHDVDIREIRGELREQNRDLVVLADVVFRARLRDRLALAKRLRAARSRDR